MIRTSAEESGAVMPTCWVTLPENRAAACAAGRVAGCVASGAARREVNPLFIHGPTGSGKTRLLSDLLAEVAARAPGRRFVVLQAGEFAELARREPPAEELTEARQADLLAVEDVQHLPPRVAEPFVRLLDGHLARQRQLVVTALAGPAQLRQLPARLTSRLGQGVVVGLEPLSLASRQVFLRERAKARGLEAADGVLAWLAAHTPGSARQLEGALTRLEGLARVCGRAPTADEVAGHFQEAGAAPSVERIAQRVGSYFHVAPALLRSRRRSRDALLARQVGMYLARRVTRLSLGQIGAFFGGRDHSTVLHACRKVEAALAHDAALSGAVRRLHADLA